MGGYFYSFSQNAFEAYRYSKTYASGTARGLAVGGAFAALGGDLTSVGLNPGGLGMYRSSEGSFSFNLNHTNAESNFQKEASESKLNFHIPNIGFVFNRMYEDKRGNRSRGKWVAVNFAFSLNRQANFNTKRFYQNDINAQSLMPILATELNGLREEDITFGSASFESVLGYAGFLINPIAGDSTNYSSITDNIPIAKEVSIRSEGKMDEMAFSLAANHNDKIYFGATLGIPFIRYTEQIIYSESNMDRSLSDFENFSLQRKIRTTGTGVNLKVGAVYRVYDWLRLGASLHTPTYIGMRDKFSNQIESNFTNQQVIEVSPDGRFKYKLTTPWRGIFGAAFVFRKLGFISLDYEYADFNSANYSFSNAFQSIQAERNKEINGVLKASHTFKIGVEAIANQMRFRLGYNYATQPFESEFKKYNHRNPQSFSGGVGYKGESFQVDFAYVRSISDNPILLSNTTVSADKISRSNFIVSAGFRF